MKNVENLRGGTDVILGPGKTYYSLHATLNEWKHNNLS